MEIKSVFNLNKEKIASEYDGKKELEDLPKKEKEILFSWIDRNLTKTKNINYNAKRAYGLKHVFENYGGFYMHTEAFKEAMITKGFKAERLIDEYGKYHTNWYFNVGKRIRCEEEKKKAYGQRGYRKAIQRMENRGVTQNVRKTNRRKTKK